MMQFEKKIYIFDEIQMTDMMIMIQILGQCGQMDFRGTGDAAEEPKRRLLRRRGLYITSSGT